MSSFISKQVKKRVTAVVLACAVTVTLVLPGCQTNDPKKQNRAFQAYTEEVFCRETASNTISLHYTLKEPEAYGIKEIPNTFGTYITEKDELLASVENMRRALEQFSFELLSRENQLTYDVFTAHLDAAAKNAEYLLYDEPLGTVSGIQTQLPVLLSEYQFYEKEDVEEYLNLLKTTPEYFASLIAYEKKKAAAGLFMSDQMASQVIKQCDAFMNMGESNYLISTFVERVTQLSELTKEEQSKYIEKNAMMLHTYVLPSYSKLAAALQELKGTGENEKGLCYLPDGKAYYEQKVQTDTGSDRSVIEMEDLTRRQIVADLEAMEAVLGISAQETAVLEETNPELILNNLEKQMETSFPKAPDTTISIKYVPEDMQEHLSPAFYLIPAIDDQQENVIYINEAHMGDDLTLFTTLAHEGYPGHLYQTTYYAATDPDPLRSILNFGGYVEGWATYAEMCSYYIAGLTKEQATLLQKNASIILGLYALADMGVHYEGWDRGELLAFFTNYGIKNEAAVERVYDLILGSPGNYLKYYIGYLEFLELKKEWAAELGENFSHKEFHQAVLSIGPAPFSIVRQYMFGDER